MFVCLCVGEGEGTRVRECLYEKGGKVCFLFVRVAKRESRKDCLCGGKEKLRGIVFVCVFMMVMYDEFLCVGKGGR